MELLPIIMENYYQMEQHKLQEMQTLYFTILKAHQDKQDFTLIQLLKIISLLQVQQAQHISG